MLSQLATASSLAVLGIVALLAGSADAHQRVTIPAPTYTNDDRNVNWSPLAFLENQGVKTNADILGYIKTKNVKNLREFMDNKANYKIEAAGASFDCGYTNPNGARQPIPANGMMRSSGYTHEGPCEIWIDDVMVKHGDNCHSDIGSTAVSYKIDFSACKGDCMLRWYWFGNRPIGSKRSWQVYKACIPLKGSGSRGSANKTSDAVAGEASAKPTATSTAPATQLPVTSTPAATGAGSASGNKCKAKRL